MRENNENLGCLCAQGAMMISLTDRFKSFHFSKVEQIFKSWSS